MKLLFSNVRIGRAQETSDGRRAYARVDADTGDDTLGRGMEIALTVGLFTLVGWLLDSWLGIFPVMTIVLVVFACVGMFVRMRYAYEAAMQRHEAERAERMRQREDAS